jgi:hypothetical protein
MVGDNISPVGVRSKHSLPDGEGNARRKNTGRENVGRGNVGGLPPPEVGGTVR